MASSANCLQCSLVPPVSFICWMKSAAGRLAKASRRSNFSGTTALWIRTSELLLGKNTQLGKTGAKFQFSGSFGKTEHHGQTKRRVPARLKRWGANDSSKHGPSLPPPCGSLLINVAIAEVLLPPARRPRSLLVFLSGTTSELVWAGRSEPLQWYISHLYYL